MRVERGQPQCEMCTRSGNVPVRKSTMDSYGSKSSVSGLPMIHASVTMNLEKVLRLVLHPNVTPWDPNTYGMTKRAICCRRKLLASKLEQPRLSGLMALTILEPTATPKLRSILSLTETVTAVTCSKDEKSVNTDGPSDGTRTTHLLRFLR